MTIRKLFVMMLLLLSAVSVSAQANVVPVVIGENVTGEVNASAPVAAFSVEVLTPQTLEIQVLTIGSGLSPAFRVIDPSGLVLQSVDNSAGRSSVSATVPFSAPGTYRIEVSGTFGSAGNFLLVVQEGEALEAPEPLQPGEAITGRVDSQQTRAAFLVTASLNTFQLLSAETRSTGTSPVFVMRDAESGEMLGSAGALLGGARFRLPPGSTDFVLEVLFSGQPADFFVCLEGGAGTVACPGSTSDVIQPTVVVTQPVSQAFPTSTPSLFAPTPIPLPTISATGPCTVATLGTTLVNVRSAPGTNFGIVSRLLPQMTALVFGRLPDSSWYQVQVNGDTGWVFGQVVRIGGLCGSLTIINFPTPTGGPTTIATTSVFTATWTPTTIFTATPSATPTATLTPTVVATLNYGLSPNYGSMALTAGFVPDPFTVGITSGGSVNVSYLGGGCTGFATSAPDFRVNYTSGGATLLRFYFVGGGDSTMVINAPSASYFCNDDSHGKVDPTIDFNTPSGGAYDVWIGSYSQGTFISGTLYVTENTGNHP